MILRSVRLGLSVLVLTLVVMGQALAVPSIKVGTGFEVSPAAAWTYYAGQGTTSPAWTEDPELKVLAAALGNDPDKIYNYVHDEIEVIPLFGVNAGARGAFIDKAGTPFDQAQLMVELLRSAGITATYQLGTITLTGTQFADWFGVSNADAARKLLADGGYPASVTGGSTVTSVTMMHLWVKATINGTVYAFDPSFKSHTVKNAIDVGTAMGFSASTFWTSATTGVTTNANGISTLNRTNVRSNLSSYASTLLNYIQTNLPTGSIEDVIGGRTPVANTGGPLRQVSLAYQSGTYTSFTGDIPLCLRTQVNFQFAGGGQQNTFNWTLDDIYGKQIAFEFNDVNPAPSASSQFRFLLGDTPATGWLTGTIGGATVTINHPYAAGPTSGSTTGSYMDRSIFLEGQTSGSMQIVIAGGRPSAEFGAYQERTHSGRSANTQFPQIDNTENAPWYQPQQLSLRRRMVASFLSQFADMSEMVGGESDSFVLIHDVIGAVTVTPTLVAGSQSPVASSFVLDIEPGISAVSRTAAAGQTTVVTRTVGMMMSALEGNITQQNADSIYPVSAVAQLDWANFGPSNSADRWYYYADATNWATIKPLILLDYAGKSPAGGAAEGYINAGYVVMIPKSSFLGPGPANLHWCNSNTLFTGINCDTTGPDRAGAFIAFNPTTGDIAHVSARDTTTSKGGGGTADVETSPTKIFNVGDDFLQKQFTSRGEAGKVDLKTGLLDYTAPADLVVGNGGYPYSLSFQRSYRSGKYNSVNDLVGDQQAHFTTARDPLFGDSGWVSNLVHYASVTSDGAKVFGRDDPRVAAQTLATIKVLLSLMANGASNLETLERQIIGAHAAFWWTESVQENTITINQGAASRGFTRLANGTYSSRGSAETVELLGTRTVYVPTKGQHVWWYKHCVRLTGAQRDVTLYGVWDSGLTNCVGPAGPGTKFQGEGNTGNMSFLRQTFPFGVTVSWDKLTGTLSNSLGRSISIAATGPEGYGGTVTSSAGQSVTFTQEAGLYGYGSTLKVTPAFGAGTWTYIDTGTSFEVRPPSTPTQASLHYDYQTGSYGSVSQLKDALLHATLYKIGGGRVGAVIDPLGNATRSYHDRFGNLWKVEDPLGRSTTTLYDALQRKSKVIAPEGNSEEYTYDGRSNVLTTKLNPKTGSPASPITKSTVTYDSLCNVPLTSTDALGRTTTTTINQTTCLTTTITGPSVNSQSPVTSYTYNSIGKMIQKTDPTGLVTQVNYDAYGNPTSVVVDPGTSGHVAATTVFNYDSVGNITSFVDPRGNTHSGTYDALRRLTSYTAPASTGASTTWTYDVDGMITSISKANGTTPSVTTYSYWATGQVRSMTDPDGRVTQYDYDAANRLTYTTDPELRRSLKIYNAASEVIEERRAVGLAEEQAYSRFTYTLNGKQATIKDAKANTTTYAYDDFDRLKTTTLPDNTFEQLAYDDVDNITSKVTRGGQTIQNQYDALNRLILHIVPQPSPTTAIQTAYTYDLAGRTLTVTDTTGQGLTYGFDSAKRVISVAQTAPNITGSRTINYELDAAGNKTKAVWPEGYFVSYQYDALNRMTNVIENGTTPLATYVYDALSRRTSLAYGNGTSQSFTYSTGGDLLTLAHTLSGTGNTWTNTYTKAHQLLSEAASNASWQYLPAVFETTTYGAANNLNQYVVVTKGANPTVTLIYDANGNLTADGTWAFAYDAENRLKTAAKSGTTASYLYDPLGRRQAKVVNSVTTSFLSDGDEEIAEYDGSGGLLRRYIPGPGTDQPIAMVTVSGSTLVHSYFHVNRQGSTVAMSNDSGAVSEGPYTYDAYGQGAPLTGVPFKYTGRRLDAETGLYYYRARYYSASLGRFLQTDPIGYRDQLNLYGYVGNDPTDGLDPSGSCDIGKKGAKTDGTTPAAHCEVKTDSRSVYKRVRGGGDQREAARKAERLLTKIDEHINSHRDQVSNEYVGFYNKIEWNIEEPTGGGFAQTRAMWSNETGRYYRAQIGSAWFMQSDNDSIVTLLHEPTHFLNFYFEQWRRIPKPYTMQNPAARQLEADIDNYAILLGRRIDLLPPEYPLMTPDQYIP